MKGGLIFSFLVVLLSVFFTINGLRSSDGAPTPSLDDKETVYIVYLSEEPLEGVHSQAYDISILSSVLGSEEACHHALLYSYPMINGFAAQLTPDQAELLKKTPGVLKVIKDSSFNFIDYTYA